MRFILRRLQRGFTLIEALAALSVASIAMVGIASSMDDTIEETRSITAIQYLSEFNVAAGRFVNLNTATYLSSLGDGALTTVDIKRLQNDGFLTTAFQTSNVYGQTPCLIIRKSGPSTLEAMMLTVNHPTTKGGFMVPKKLYTSIAAKAGIGIASDITKKDSPILANAQGLPIAQGMGGAWVQDLTNFSNQACVGTTTLNSSSTAKDRLQFASLLTSNALAVTSAPYLYRGVVSSHPELNQMFTDLDFNGGGTKHDLINAGNIDTQTAAIASNATVGGTLGVTNNATLGALNVTGATTLQSTTNVNGLLNATNSQNIIGDLTVSGQVSANSAALTDKLITKDIIVTGDIDSYGSIGVRNGNVSILNGNMTIKGDNVFHRVKLHIQRESGRTDGWTKCPSGTLVGGGVDCRNGGSNDVAKSHPDGDNIWRYECTGKGDHILYITCME